MWPGVSRSASTIIGGMLGGLDRRTATEYSFLAAVPVMIAATGYDFLKIRASLGYDDLWFFGVGFVVSFIFAAISIKTFIGLVKRWSLAPYAIYRIIIAPVIYFTMT
jgi:undecaprenyl-diphosphatase